MDTERYDTEFVEMTVLLDLPRQIADALSSPICNIDPYQGRQPTEGARLFVGSLEFFDGPLDTSSARRKVVLYTVTAYISVSLGENVEAERLLAQLCHGENSWHQRLRLSGINGVRPLDGGISISRDKEVNSRLVITVTADIEVEIAAFVKPQPPT